MNSSARLALRSVTNRLHPGIEVFAACLHVGPYLNVCFAR
jgi:hypothetical protein